MIEIMEATENPIKAISRAAGMSYGKEDTSRARVRNCLMNGHMSVFEHAHVTFKVTDISRACSHQLVRHRLASFVQRSQRYCKVDTESDWYVTPESFDNAMYHSMMDEIAIEYQKAIKEGLKPEDARYILPEACKTELVVTMNVRELFHFFELRLDKAAQWEIRKMAKELYERVSRISLEWEALLTTWHTMKFIEQFG